MSEFGSPLKPFVSFQLWKERNHFGTFSHKSTLERKNIDTFGYKSMEERRKKYKE
jgi:hypothetical protein